MSTVSYGGHGRQVRLAGWLFPVLYPDMSATLTGWRPSPGSTMDPFYRHEAECLIGQTITALAGLQRELDGLLLACLPPTDDAPASSGGIGLAYDLAMLATIVDSVFTNDRAARVAFGRFISRTSRLHQRVQQLIRNATTFPLCASDVGALRVEPSRVDEITGLASEWHSRLRSIPVEKRRLSVDPTFCYGLRV